MDPSPENNRAAWYQGPIKLEVVKSYGATHAKAVYVVKTNVCTKSLTSEMSYVPSALKPYLSMKATNN